jgi:hypothetical protein
MGMRMFAVGGLSISPSGQLFESHACDVYQNQNSKSRGKRVITLFEIKMRRPTTFALSPLSSSTRSPPYINGQWSRLKQCHVCYNFLWMHLGASKNMGGKNKQKRGEQSQNNPIATTFTHTRLSL